ncbi:hypothetical protein FXV77_21315 [Sphingobacterium phlebotomi]|uniref:Uncharacterized protein n=1 Tax=Sphingobacterium phlebotomi TaxID=2605433 RepID=A0A5D4GR47_9SPHI|nr:hypothetical protein [Sphingobacterium phlebotomi]TYR31236.1 hypothetical protein FXV77_21315 [Sphingobacterium phlebotomi]
MKTIYIHHPLRDITYKSKKERYFMDSERQALLDYRTAHDNTWRMKLRFEKARGEVFLAQNQLHDIDYEREELEEMWGYYLKQVDLTDVDIIHNIEIRFQVELRDFYLQVRKLHQRIIKFYDNVAVLDSEYTDLTNTYFKSSKPIDPLNFSILDDIFKFHEDRETDIKSLDKDLQEFLQTLTAVYALLDDYIQSYNTFYQHYSTSLQNVEQLMKATQKLNSIWGDEG